MYGRPVAATTLLVGSRGLPLPADATERVHIGERLRGRARGPPLLDRDDARFHHVQRRPVLVRCPVPTYPAPAPLGARGRRRGLAGRGPGAGSAWAWPRTATAGRTMRPAPRGKRRSLAARRRTWFVRPGRSSTPCSSHRPFRAPECLGNQARKALFPRCSRRYRGCGTMGTCRGSRRRGRLAERGRTGQAARPVLRHLGRARRRPVAAAERPAAVRARPGEPGRRVSRDLACEELFAGLDPRAAARSVSKALSMARGRALRAAARRAGLLARWPT